MSRRFDYGISAWQATVGYICTHHSPDGLLNIKVHPKNEAEICWSASVSWGQCIESVQECASIGAAFSHLWHQVEAHHHLFESAEDEARCPRGYEEHEWLDVNTQDVLHRLIWTTSLVFKTNWQIVMIYQPTEKASTRVQIRLLANDNNIQVGSRGASFIEALRLLFRNAVPVFAEFSGSVTT